RRPARHSGSRRPARTGCRSSARSWVAPSSVSALRADGPGRQDSSAAGSPLLGPSTHEEVNSLILFLACRNATGRPILIYRKAQEINDILREVVTVRSEAIS